MAYDVDCTQQRIRQLTNTLLADYEKGRVVDKKNHFDDPSKEIVVDILKKVQIIIFPGYFRNEHYRTYTMENTVSMLLEDVLYNLTKQISLVWKHVEGKSGITPEQAWEEAQEIEPIWSQNNAGKQHTKQTRQFDLLAQPSHAHAQNKDQ